MRGLTETLTYYVWKLELYKKKIKKKSRFFFPPITYSLLDEGSIEYSGVKMWNSGRTNSALRSLHPAACGRTKTGAPTLRQRCLRFDYDIWSIAGFQQQFTNNITEYYNFQKIIRISECILDQSVQGRMKRTKRGSGSSATLFYNMFVWSRVFRHSYHKYWPSKLTATT